MRFYSQKTAKSYIKSLFIALESRARGFINGQVVSKATRAIITYVTTVGRYHLVSLLLLLAVLASSTNVFSGQSEIEENIGEVSSLNVYPGSFKSEGWSKTEQALQVDLSDDALFQEFSRSNSAFIPRPGEEILVEPTNFEESPEATLVPPVSVPIDAETSGDQNDSAPNELAEPEVPGESVEQTPEEPVSVPENEAESFSDPAPEESVSVYKKATASLYTALTFAFESFPFVNSSTSLESDDYAIADVTIEEESESVELESQDLLPDVGFETESEVDASANEQIVTDQTLETETIETVVTDVETTSVANQTTPSNGSRHTLVFSDFSIPKLQPGEFITGVQLRASLAARYEVTASGTLPYFDFTFKTPSTTQNVGSVLVTEETSNALNGGYYLFSLPEIETEAELDNVSIEVSFVGDPTNIEDVYFDAVWLEVNTEKITREDLVARTEAEIARHLHQPQANEMVSKKLNFLKEESPVFNLRYVSQRSKIVQTVRELFGYDKVRVSEVKVLHAGLQLTGIKPNMTVTPSGLITVDFPDSATLDMKPGKYAVEFEVDEGGYTFKDGFEFQWGLLAINPDQSEYEEGEMATISMAALTPNGNTICDANLRLYIIDPEAFIHKVPVTSSGQCLGNNVVDVPDYNTAYNTTVPGTYEMYLERLAEDGSVISHTSDTFEVVEAHALSITRNGPTRIYPPAPYEMSLSVEADEAFDGTLIERVPASFAVYDTDARVEVVGDFKELTWNVSVAAGSSDTYSYAFDAPDLSPFLFELGPATLEGVSPLSRGQNATTNNGNDGQNGNGGNGVGNGNNGNASSTIVAAPTLPIKTNVRTGFTENRTWQIASDATGNMIIYWDNASYIPSGWSCLSCGSGTFYQRFAMGSSTYNATGGAATHTHTGTGSVLATSLANTESGGGTISPVAHTHTYTPTIGSASNLPSYRQLRVLQYTGSTGEPPSIPAGAIGIFDVASSSLPSGWNRYAAQDGYYVYGENTPGTTGGSNTHTHAISGTTGAAAGTNTRTRGTPTQVAGSASTHTHTVSSTTPSVSVRPPYIEVVFAKLAATSTVPNNLITMWTDEVPSGWLDVSSAPTDPFSSRFLVGATAYSATGGVSTHAHSDMSNIVSSAPSATTNGVQASPGFGAAGTHTHNVNVTGFSTTSNLPPYLTVIFGKRQGTDPVYDQLSYRWYANTNNQTPTDAWPVGGSDLTERESITATSTTVSDGDVLRLRINTAVSNATSTAGSTFKLQYAAADTCSTLSSWVDVGTAASTTALWRGYNNTSVNDHVTLTTLLLASSTVLETYAENGLATSTPNAISAGAKGEWDFVLQQNGAAAGTNYCFRMVETDNTAFSSYSYYPQVLTNQAPNAPTLEKPFDNEKTASTSLKFQFVAEDPEAESLNYQIQIDNDYSFASTLEDRNTVSNATQFENLIDNPDKAPFTSGQLMQFTAASTFTNSTTYYWRVRATDPDGSADYGEWSEIYSFTIDTSLTASAWFQTTEEQFDSNTLIGLDSLVTDEVSLISGSTTGTLTSDPIEFADGDSGTAWDSFVFSDTETTGDIKYKIEYLNTSAIWTAIPDTALPGNSSGFDTSPVDLLSLDVNTYDTIRIVATFTNSGGSPSLQSWGVNWGYRVETPTITKLFPNEKTGTTTPIFEFTTTDPQSDSLTYQISWSTDDTFTSGTTTRTSGTHSGFSNIDNGGDTDPFFSGNTIQFKVQSGDALTSGTTYWWRVRAKDTTGDNAYSFWSDPRSFTVDTAVVASTWFQTTQEQFDSNILSGTIGLANDTVSVATTASEAMLVYGEGTVTEPRFRQWDGSSWGSEGTLLDIAAPLQHVKVKAGTTREEFVAVTVGTDADVNAQVFATGEWGDLQEMTTNVGNTNARGIDVAYESTSGDAMVAYCNNAADPAYRIWNGSTWSSAGTINIAETTNCDWLQLASDPTSDEIVVLVRGTDGNPYEAQVWNGSSWGNSTTLGNIVDTAHEGMAVAYEESGNQAVIVASDGNPARFAWNSWNGTIWVGAGTQALEDDFEWGTLVSDKGSDELALCYQDEDTNIGYVRWTGAAWAGQGELLTTTGKAKTDPGFSCVFEDGGSRDNYIMTAYTNTTQTNYSFWNNTTWSTGALLGSLGDTITSELIRTGNGGILGIFFDETNDDLLFSNWNGTTWATSTAVETNASVGTSPYGRPYSLAPRGPGSAGTTVVSLGIDFDDGLGPYWEEMSWNDSTPGSSNILYSVQYYDGDSWEFIPDGEIAGNSSGITTSPIDLTGLNKNTYNIIRPYAALSCAGGNCPQLQDWTITWAEGITISGTVDQYDRTTDVTSGTVNVAVNGVLQSGKSGTIAAGAWSIDNVTVFEGDIITVFISGAADANEAVGVTRYDGIGDVTGMTLFERHVALGSDDATTTPLTNFDVAEYTATNDEDVFLNISGSALNLCADVGCSDAVLYVGSTARFAPNGNVTTHDVVNNGRLTASTTLFVSGSWDNNATTTLTGSTVVMTATTSTESIDTTGAAVFTFNNLTFGTTTGSASWTLGTTLDVDGNLTVTRGTLARATTAITVAGNLVNGTNGLWTGIGTTTFDGSVARTWSDQNATKQNVGRVVIDGASKIVTLASNVLAQSLTVGSNDAFDASTSNYNITVYGSWNNNNSFLARSGTVIFAATSSTQSIKVGGDAFYNLNFTGSGGGWSFTESTLTVNNDLTITAGTVTLPTATTTIVGSFSNNGGAFAHNNSLVLFTSSAAETITTDGDAFTNAFYDLRFNGGGSWTFTEAYATSSNNVVVTAGTVVLPSSTLAVGGSLQDIGGTINANNGTILMYSSGAESLQAGGSTLNNLIVDGAGTFTITDTNATLTGDVTVNAGTLVLPSGVLTLGGSLDNNATLTANNGEILFNSTDTGEIVDFGTSSAYDLTFNAAGGGWTVTSHATATNEFILTNASTFELSSGRTLSVGNLFTNSVGGASTTWSGTTLALRSGTYSINTKTNQGDSYGTLSVNSPAEVSMWNSSAASYAVDAGSYLYSMDHAAVNGDLYVWGDYTRSSGSEHWSYATDFDGTNLTGGNERQVDVRFASGATAALTGSTLEVLGNSTASTTVANQGSGTYTVGVSGGTVNARYYTFADLGSTGLSLTNSVAVTSLRDASYTVAAAAGSALTVSSTTIDANPAEQIYNVAFATTTAIAATNVTQTGSAPSSYWWFRNSSGNLDGEAYDSDTGNPGSVRWDDSALNLTISGTVYADDGVTPLGGTTCDGDAQEPVTVVVSGGATYTGVCEADSSFSIGGIVVVGDPTITVYLDGAAGGQKATVVTKTPTTDITDLDLYVNRVIVRHEDVDPMSIEDMAKFDYTNDSDVSFDAATSTTDSLVINSGTELYVWGSKTFEPGGTVIIAANAAGNDYDGSLHLAANSVFTAAGTTTYQVGGSIVLENGATFTPASSTIMMTATTTGKTITTVSTSSLAVHDMQFVGSGGWNLAGNIQAYGDIALSAGTLTGTGNITLENGSLSGNGLLSLGSGTVTLKRTNTLGGTQGWTFDDLVLGDGTNVGTTTPAGTATTTILGTLTISTGHFLDAGSSVWDLSGSGTVFVENGTFLEDTSSVTYSGSGATDVISTNYYDLNFNAIGGSPTYTATGLGIQVFGDMIVGGATTTTVTFDTNDTALNIDGNLGIVSGGTFIASNSGTFTLAGNYDNNGTLTASGGTITFDGSGTATIAAGSSSFATALLSGTGTYTVSEHATATTAFTLGATLTSFTLSSGQTLAVGGTFTNSLGGAATTWTGSQLYLYGGGNYEVNPKTTSETYNILSIASDTQIRTWNSSASTVNVTGGSLYSMDHAASNGDLNIYGTYTKTSGTDHWSYATDFDGASLSGSERQVSVSVVGGGSVTYGGTGALAVNGASGNETTVANQGSGTYAFTVGGAASTTFMHYAIEDTTANGLVFTATPLVHNLSYGLYIVGSNGNSAITVGGTVIDANPAKTFTNNTFATSSGVSSGINVTATGTSVSSWRFTNHGGDIDGEAFDSDPDGDPGYVSWDDSAANITITGTVYSDEGSTMSTACPGGAVRVRVAGLTSYDTTCNGSGVYSVTGVTYSPGDSIVVYLNDETENATAVTVDPVSNIGNMHLYENRVIVRHEGVDPMTIDDMATWDSSDDADILFTAVSGSPDTLTLPADTKLIVWNGKNFAPGGNVTIPGGGSGNPYDGSLELYSNADWTAAGTEAYTVGGSMVLGAGANLSAANSTFTFTTSGSRTIDTNNDEFYNVTFNGTGSWSITNSTFGANDVLISDGSVSLPTGTTTVSGYFNNTGGDFTSNGSPMVFDGSGAGATVAFGGSDVGALYFTGSGSWNMTDTNATSTGGVTITDGTVSLPSGYLSLANSFRNLSGTVTHNTAEIVISTSSVATVLASSSDLFAVTFGGGGTFTFEDEDLALLGSLRLNSGSLTLASGTLSVGGSLLATGGTFDHASGTILFNSTDTGETIDPGSSAFYDVVFGSATGGWTITGNATTTNIFSLTTAASFTQQTGTRLYVGGVFSNDVSNSVTTWTGSTLVLDSGTTYEINDKTNGDDYQTLIVGADTDVSAWNSKATTTTVANSSSFYSQDHGATNGALYIYGDYHIATTTEYWSYATDFDGTSLSGSERAVTVAIASGATTTLDGGSLQIVGVSGNETTITNQGSGQYAMIVSGGTFNANYYDVRNLNSSGLTFTGTPVISSLSYGDFELAVNGGRLINLSSTTLNYNASLIIIGNRFATTSAITGTNVYLTGSTSNAWTFTSHTGNLDGESYDFDGATACGSVRWSDSSCLLVQQTHYRWRDDDGGLGVPDTEWFDQDWAKRKSVSLDNSDATTYTDAVIELSIPYDSDMLLEFTDLRFTDESGTTTLPHFIASTTSGVSAEVWVQVPTLPAEDTATIYMYYDNPVATAVSSSTLTFIAADDFEDGNIAEYTGAGDDKGLFAVNSTRAYGSSDYGLDNTGNTNSRANDGGMARFDQTVSQGETIRYMQYVSTTGGSDEVCTMFAVQSPVTAHNNYAVCLEQVAGSDYIALVEDVTDVATPANILASSTVTYTAGWHEVEIDWGTDDSITVSLYDDTETLVTSFSHTDGTYTSGGIGFTYWYNGGGWDNYTSRPLITTEPTVRFGAEITDGGANWATDQDTALTIAPSDNVRLRLAIENSGLPITNQTFELEYAVKGNAPSCQSVSGSSYISVPNQASCGSSPLCMQTTTHFVDGADTANLLTGTQGAFVTGKAVESPSNTSASINLDQDYFTELEYAIATTLNATSSSYCLRVTDAGNELDTYLRVAQLNLRFDPAVTDVSLNSGLDISLTPGATTTVYATGTVTDLNGYLDLVSATSTIYRSGAGAACTADNNNCYISSGSSCSFSSCSGNSCQVSCRADIYFHADATDVLPYEGEEWLALIEVIDQSDGIDIGAVPEGVELFSLQALDVSNAINYGSLAVSSSTGSYNPTTTIQNLGNISIDIDVEGSNLSDGATSEIPAEQQIFATSSFDYSSCVQCTQLTTTTISDYEVDLSKPSVASPPVEDIIYWGIEIPYGVSSNPYTGVNIIYATND